MKIMRIFSAMIFSALGSSLFGFGGQPQTPGMRSSTPQTTVGPHGIASSVHTVPAQGRPGNFNVSRAQGGPVRRYATAPGRDDFGAVRARTIVASTSKTHVPASPGKGTGRRWTGVRGGVGYPVSFTGTHGGPRERVGVGHYVPRGWETTELYGEPAYVSEVQPISYLEQVVRKLPIRRIPAVEQTSALPEGFVHVIYATDDCFVDESGRLICPAGAYVTKNPS